jgi:GNAT superfamily N-acetyltransferase
MTDLCYKRAGIESLEILVDLRMEFILDIHPEYPVDLMKKIHKATMEYFREAIGNNAYLGFLGVLSTGEIICTAGVLIYYLPPLKTESYRKIGHVLNFYTKPGYRRKNYGFELMEFMKKTAKEERICRLVLNSTAMGVPLYEKSGFTEPEDKGMSLDL